MDVESIQIELFSHIAHTHTHVRVHGHGVKWENKRKKNKFILHNFPCLPMVFYPLY